MPRDSSSEPQKSRETSRRKRPRRVPTCYWQQSLILLMMQLSAKGWMAPSPVGTKRLRDYLVIIALASKSGRPNRNMIRRPRHDRNNSGDAQAPPPPEPPRPNSPAWLMRPSLTDIWTRCGYLVVVGQVAFGSHGSFFRRFGNAHT
jgi:hypothetical protein